MITPSDTVRVIDFGLSKASNKKFHAMAGTPYYMAPEVLDTSIAYTTKADVWSLGVLLYTLVSGYLPFQGSSSKEVFKRIKNADYHFNHIEFDSVSTECKDLISKLLVVNEKKRFTGKQAIEHAWFTKFSEKAAKSGDDLDDKVLDRLKNYKGVSTLKRAAMNLLVKMANENEVNELKKQFVQIDEDGSGLILASELAQIIRKKHMNMSDKEIKDLINEVDYHGNGKINYSEFLSATIDLRMFLDDSKLMAVFSQFDTDNSGKITKENIKLAMEKLGQHVPMSEIKTMVEKHDLTKDGMLSFEEFKQIFY